MFKKQSHVDPYCAGGTSPPAPANDTVSSATPDKRKGPSMARRGQVGRIEVSGKWYVVRFWKYPKGQERIHASEKLCLTDPKSEGFLSRGERRRKANQIVEASGVNDEQQFVDSHLGVTFREQAKRFMSHSMMRKRNPVKTATITTWDCSIEKWLNPHLGDMPLSTVGNAAAKTIVAKMHGAGLSAKTIANYFGLVKRERYVNRILRKMFVA